MFRKVTWAGALLLVLVGCGQSPRRGYYTTGGGTYPPTGGGGTGTGGGGTVAAGGGGSADPRSLLGQTDAALRGQGFTIMGSAVHGNLAAGGVIAYGVTAQAGLCYTVFALAQPGQDLDLLVFDDQGGALGHDVNPDSHPWVVACPTRPGRLIARVQFSGASSGEYFYAAYAGRSSTRASLAGVFGTSPSAGGGTTGTGATGGGGGTGGGLEENARLLDADMRARGYVPFGDAQTGSLEQAQTRDIPIELEGGKCYAILAVGDSGVRDLDLLIFDAGGTQIDRDRAPDARPIVRVCAERSGTYRMQVRMFAGAGHWAYQAYRWPRGTTGPFGLRGIIYVRLAEVTAILQVDGYVPDENFAPGRGALRRSGATAQHDVDLQGGQCYAVLAVGGEGISDLDLSLSQGGSALATDQAVSAFPSVRHCATSTGTYRIDLRAADGQGPYFYQVFRRGAE